MAGRRSRSERDARRRSHGQNFLRSSALAAELVVEAEIDEQDLVLDIGAGSGVLTTALSRVARRVVALEIDPAWAAQLEERFRRKASVTVIQGDILRTALPTEPFRVFSSLPFSGATPILRRLLDEPQIHLARADVIVQWEAGMKRILLPPRNALTIEWSPWWRFSIARRISAECFRPVPAVDAALVVIQRKSEPVLDPAHRDRFRELVREGFARAQMPLVRALDRGRSGGEIRRGLAEIGASHRATAGELTAHQWAGLFRSWKL